jgi:hypothetical protein
MGLGTVPEQEGVTEGFGPHNGCTAALWVESVHGKKKKKVRGD